MKKMKILLVTDQYFSANNGMTISSRRFAGKLREHGHEVRIVSTGKPGDTEYLMPEYHLPVFDKLIMSQGMMFAATDKELLTKAIKWADVVHFLAPFALEHNGIIICRELKKPYTAAFHVQPENITSSIHMGKLGFVNNGIYHWFHHYIYKYTEHIHCPSNFIARQLEEHGYREKLHVISNGIDPDFVYNKTEKPPELEGKFVILTIGRYSIEKRQYISMRAISKSKYKDRIVLIAAGQGPRQKALKLIAEKLGIPVIFKFFSKEELLKVISFSDLYIHAAAAEIEAMACMEAFAGGLVPVIADSKKSATPQFALDDRSLFKLDSCADLAEKIDYWIEHEDERKEMELRYSELGKKYELDACVKEAEEMFMSAIKEQEAQHE